jgi:hypothetical protein
MKARKRWRIMYFRKKKITTNPTGTEIITIHLQAGPKYFSSIYFSGFISSLNRNYDIALKVSVSVLLNYFLHLSALNTATNPLLFKQALKFWKCKKCICKICRIPMIIPEVKYADPITLILHHKALKKSQ